MTQPTERELQDLLSLRSIYITAQREYIAAQELLGEATPAFQALIANCEEAEAKVQESTYPFTDLLVRLGYVRRDTYAVHYCYLEAFDEGLGNDIPDWAVVPLIISSHD
jgi:hypothetical protein